MDKKVMNSLKLLFLGDALINESYASNHLGQPPYKDNSESAKILKILSKAVDKQDKK